MFLIMLVVGNLTVDIISFGRITLIVNRNKQLNNNSYLKISSQMDSILKSIVACHKNDLEVVLVKGQALLFKALWSLGSWRLGAFRGA